MAFSEASVSFSMASDADFRTWCQAVHDGLDAAGLVQTADTGQINLSTVSVPGVANTVAGYEIWRFDDASQATNPVFIKLEYGTGSSTSRPQIKAEAGTGSDGSGAITDGYGTGTTIPSSNPSGTGSVTVSHFDGEVLIAVSITAAGGSSASAIYCAGRARKGTDGTVASAGTLFAVSPPTLSTSMRCRVAGSWSSANGELSPPSSIVSGVVVFGRCRPIGYPCLPLRSFLYCPSSIGAGDTGTVETDFVSASFKKPLTNVADGNGSIVVRSSV